MDGIEAKPQKVEPGQSNLGSSKPGHFLNTASKIIQKLKFTEITNRTSTASISIQLDQVHLRMRILRVEKLVVLAIKAKAENIPQLNQAISTLEPFGWTATPLKTEEIVFVRLLTQPSPLVLASQLQILLSELV